MASQPMPVLNVLFQPSIDEQAGRVDIVIVRPNDTTGVAGTGLLAAVLFDAIGAGPGNLNVSGTAGGPGGTALPVQVLPAPGVVVR